MTLNSIIATLKFLATHPLTARSPAGAFWRYGRWQIESRLRSEVEIDWIEGTKLVARNGMTGATGNIYCGLHEFADMAFVIHMLTPGDLFVDIGANIGSYTVLASALCGARSIAVEPDPGTMVALKRNIEANRIWDRVTTVEAAVGATAGTGRFTLGQDTTNRVVAATSAETREVQLVALDSLVEHETPMLIKIDVEGYENEVVAGAAKALRNPSLRAILIETVEPSVHLRLETEGFECMDYSPFERHLSPAGSGGPAARSSLSNALYVRDLAFCQKRIETAAYRGILGNRV